MVGMLRSFFKPGASPGTMIIEARSYASACGSVTTMAIRKSAIIPFDVNHLWPLITHSSPSSTAVVESIVGSEPAVLGSVMENGGRIARMKPASSTSRTSSGYTSSRTKLRIHSSFFSNSGSVEKSQAMARLLVVRLEHGDAVVDHARDRIRQAFVHGVRPLAAPVKHEVVAVDRRVLVNAQREVPAHLVGVGAIQAVEVFDPHIDRAARVRSVMVLAPDRDDAQAAQVQQRLPDLGDLPI